jgi:hypothetical protein
MRQDEYSGREPKPLIISLELKNREEKDRVMQESQGPRERALLLVRALVTDWRLSTRNQLVWVLRLAIVVGALLAIDLLYNKTLWDWLELLIVPTALAVGGFWFNRTLQEREHTIAEENTQDTALQSYLDQMNTLLLDNELRTSEENEARILARARTLTVLELIRSKTKREPHTVPV